MNTTPYIINIQNISGRDMKGIIFDLTKKHKETSSPFSLDELHNFTLGDRIRLSCGNNDIDFRTFYSLFSEKESVIISKVKIISNNINQTNQQYSIVRYTKDLVENININNEMSDFVLNNEIYLTTGYFFKDAIITILFYPK